MVASPSASPSVPRSLPEKVEATPTNDLPEPQAFWGGDNLLETTAEAQIVSEGSALSDLARFYKFHQEARDQAIDHEVCPPPRKGVASLIVLISAVDPRLKKDLQALKIPVYLVVQQAEKKPALLSLIHPQGAPKADKILYLGTDGRPFLSRVYEERLAGLSPHDCRVHVAAENGLRTSYQEAGLSCWDQAIPCKAWKPLAHAQANARTRAQAFFLRYPLKEGKLSILYFRASPGDLKPLVSLLKALRDSKKVQFSFFRRGGRKPGCTLSSVLS